LRGPGSNITVNNIDRVFSPENTAGAYYGKLIPNRPIRVKAGGVVQWTGLVLDYRPAPLLYAERTTTLVCGSVKSALDKRSAAYKIFEDKRIDQILAELASTGGLSPSTSGKWIIGHSVYGKISDTPVIAGESDFVVTEASSITLDYAGDNIIGVENVEDGF
jgi:hypothetical protein